MAVIDDKSTDEVLAMAYSNGDESVAPVLFRRYERLLWKFALRISKYRDHSFIDDIVQITLVVIFRILKAKEFTPRFEGSFKAWVFDICKKTVYNENQHRLKHEKTVADDYVDDLSAVVNIQRTNSSMESLRKARALDRLEKALVRLEPVDRLLFNLRQDNVHYDDIIKMPEFSQFRDGKSGQLRIKYYRILEKVAKYIKEMDKQSFKTISPGKERPDKDELKCPLGALAGV